MRVLVTGGAAFIGSHVAAACARSGHHAVALDNFSRARPLNASSRYAKFTWSLLAKTPNEALSLAAAKATISHLWRLGRRLQDDYNAFAKELKLDGLTRCIGLPPR